MHLITFDLYDGSMWKYIITYIYIYIYMCIILYVIFHLVYCTLYTTYLLAVVGAVLLHARDVQTNVLITRGDKLWFVHMFW